jgi:PhzF family phenazine biosynthesis protein
MELTLYQIDAFAEKAFEGNPAAICPLARWLPDDLMQALAMENNLSETAFFVATQRGYRIRWFTPTREVDLCGHATLASAYVLFERLGYKADRILFESNSGDLTVTREGEWFTLDFPAQPPQACPVPDAIREAFAAEPAGCLKREDYIVVFDDEADVRAASPDLAKLRELDLRGVAATAGSTTHDFVLRFFGPKFGIDEDPVTGSAFTQLVPYWSQVLGKTEFLARQISRRGGLVHCRLAGDRVRIGGRAVQYMVGKVVL